MSSTWTSPRGRPAPKHKLTDLQCSRDKLTELSLFALSNILKDELKLCRKVKSKRTDFFASAGGLPTEIVPGSSAVLLSIGIALICDD